MKRRITQITLVMLGILIGALTNVATGELPTMLPAEWRDYLWLSWVPLGLSVLAVLVLEWRASRDAPPVAAGDAVQGGTLDAQGAHGVVLRPSAPVAQTNVTNSSGASASRY